MENNLDKDKIVRIKENAVIIKFLVSDILALLIGHLFFVYNYKFPYCDIYTTLYPELLQSLGSYLSLTIIVSLWIFAFYLAGNYANIARRSGLQIIWPTLSTSFILSLLLFYFLFIISPFHIQEIYLSISLKYFFIVFTLVFSFRMVLITRHYYLLKKGRIGYYGIIIGNNKRVRSVVKEFYERKQRQGYHYVGYIAENEEKGYDLSEYLPCLGQISELEQIMKDVSVDEAIVILNRASHDMVNKTINILRQQNILIKLSVDLNQVIEGTLKKQNLEFLPYITICSNTMPGWQLLLKTIFDFVFSLLGIIMLSPLFIALAIGVKLSSKGSVFYKQIRIGKNSKPFMMYKFRSMYIEAEKDGPALSSANDPRITSFGRHLRKLHLDELPQLFNVILGDMSFVGPRPERKFFIDQILRLAPHYEQLFMVKPGITSWGMVKYGYAQNVGEMIERLPYDIMYLENRTLVVDMKILLYTIRSILYGDGK
jgi:exopolysaccharide biosynthesis polyprenyl glycosylphosphotransferase